MRAPDGAGRPDVDADRPPAPGLDTRRGRLTTPVFVPDATRGAIRSVPTPLLPRHGVEALLVSTAHLATSPGPTVVRSAGGIHDFIGWTAPVISDSGGFQAFSLTQQPGLGRVSAGGLSYRFSPKQKMRELTPRSCIEAQLRIGADVIYCLDYCMHPSAPESEHERSVDMTLRWARACRDAYDALLRSVPPERRPLLFAVVQGGPHRALRERCAAELVAMGFDGFGFGGYPVVDGHLVDEVFELPQLLPPGAVLHGLGIGMPESLVAAEAAGYGVFDCTLPTRNGRRGVVYTAMDTDAIGDGRRFYRVPDLTDERWRRERGPIDPGCDCLACTTVPAGYVSHLLHVKETLGGTLASLHNLRFYSRLVEHLRAAGAGGDAAAASAGDGLPSDDGGT